MPHVPAGLSRALPLVGHVIHAERDAPYPLLQDRHRPGGAGGPHPGRRRPEHPKADLPATCGMSQRRRSGRRGVPAGAFAGPARRVPRSPLIEREILYRFAQKSPTGPRFATWRSPVILNQVAPRYRSDPHRGSTSRSVSGDIATAGAGPSSCYGTLQGCYENDAAQVSEAAAPAGGWRLMLSGRHHCERRGLPSATKARQFNREYTRLFGAPPRRDIEQLQRSDVC